MRLPGTRYQEHGWEHVRKMLGRCSLMAFARLDLASVLQGEGLPDYVDLVAEAMHGSARVDTAGNSYGESAYELALTLLYELLARPADWAAFCAAVVGEHARLGAFWSTASGDAMLRKKVNDMFAVLRDKVDSDNYQVACGRPCSPNKMYTYRMLDTAYSDIARLFAGWQEHQAQVAAILGREVDAMPIEVRQMKSIAGCRAAWVINWSASLENFGAGPGPLHTRSKRFASLKNNPDTIAVLMAEIGDYEELSSNRDHDWLHDGEDAARWMEDLWRVLDDTPHNDEPVSDLTSCSGAAEVSPPLRLVEADEPTEVVQAAQDRDGWVARVLDGESLPVKLAVYLKMLGPADDTYPPEWLDAASGELPTMAQLALLAAVSLPTLRKRRDAAIVRLHAAAPIPKERNNDY